jgi:hypothetical protein
MAVTYNAGNHHLDRDAHALLYDALGEGHEGADLVVVGLQEHRPQLDVPVGALWWPEERAEAARDLQSRLDAIMADLRAVKEECSTVLEKAAVKDLTDAIAQRKPVEDLLYIYLPKPVDAPALGAWGSRSWARLADFYRDYSDVKFTSRWDEQSIRAGREFHHRIMLLSQRGCSFHFWPLHPARHGQFIPRESIPVEPKTKSCPSGRLDRQRWRYNFQWFEYISCVLFLHNVERYHTN